MTDPGAADGDTTFTAKASALKLVSVLEPKVAVPSKGPATIAEPSASVPTSHPRSAPLPPPCVAHRKEPEESTFATKTSQSPALVSVVEPKSAVFSNDPDTIAEPSTSALTPQDSVPSSPVPPARVAQRKVPEESTFATK